MEYQVGKWYKGWKDSDKVAAKFLYCKNNLYFYFSEFIRENGSTISGVYGKHQFYNGNWHYESNLQEVTIDEIQKYLPDNHPEKIKNFYII
jgi:hypothetical protein